jgi:cytochrome c biogenesis protein CcdA
MKGAPVLLHFLPIHSAILVHVRDAIVAGSTGRMAMLILIYGGPLLGLPRIDIVSLLGSLPARNKQDAATLGGAIHFAMGILFAMIYAALWSIGIGSATWQWGLIFGAVHGILVILMLLVAIRMFPQLSEHFNALLVMLTILVNHMVFGLVVAVVYAT